MRSNTRPQDINRSDVQLCRRHKHIWQLAHARRSFAARPVVTSYSAPSCPSPSAVAGPHSGANAVLPIASLYTSQAYTHRRAIGPVQLEIIPGKGLGWRATRDVLTGELLLVSLPVAVLYGPTDEPPGNQELANAIASSWSRLAPLERNWLLLLGDCCAATGDPTATTMATALPPLPMAMDAGQELGATAAVAAEAEKDGSAPAASSSSSSSHRRAEELEGLLLRARALLAEATQQQHHHQGAPSEGSEEAATSTSYPAAGLQILPPALFGAAAAGGLQHLRGPGNSSNGNSSSNVSSVAGASGTGGGGIVTELVRRYSYGEAREDPVLSELLDVSPSDQVSVAGLWPEASLVNHSCCPNAGLLVVGGAAYVRAGRRLMEGEEVTLSYLGTRVFRHAAERRAALRASHGFLCVCPRCAAEHAHFPTVRYRELEGPRQQQGQREGNSSGSSSAALDDALLAEQLMGGGGALGRGGGPLQALLDAVFGAGRFRTGGVAPDHALLARLNGLVVSELEAAAHAALTAPSAPRARQAALLERLEGLLDQVEGSCSFLELPPRGRLMVLASVYGIVRLTSNLAELSGQATPDRRLELLRTVAEVVEAVAPGSDAHVAAVVKAAGVARRVHGAHSATTRRAEMAAATAHLARYGRELLMEPSLLRRMMATRRRLATGSGLAASMGVLAWLQHVGAPE